MIQDFENYCAADGISELEAIQTEAETAGVFGVPSYLFKKDLYWGLERLPRLLSVARSG